MAASAITSAGAGDGHDRRQRWLSIGLQRSGRKQTLFLGAHRGGDLADRAAGVFRGGLADQRDGAGGLVLPDEVHFARELVEPRLRPPCAICSTFSTWTGLSAVELRAASRRRA